MGMISERHVQAIWYDARLRPRQLFTRCGAEVKVVYPGEWNEGAGPDFTGAVLEVGGRRVKGDVEIHMTPRDWVAHGHGGDERYRGVVAHVTWRCGERPATLPSGAVSIWMGRFMTGAFSVEQVDAAEYPENRLPDAPRPCRTLVAGERAKEVLLSAGCRRLWRKTERLRRMLAATRPQQVFYSEVMGALGYSANSAGFRAIAAAVPYEQAMAEPENLSAAMLTASTFFELQRGGVRPCNLPEARLKAAAALFTETDVIALSSVNDASPDACREMVRRFTVRGLVGAGRAAAIIANVVIPFGLATGRLTMPEWLPAEDVPAIVRRVARRMFGCDHNPKRVYADNGMLVQGLLEIAVDCERFHPLCAGCGLA